MFLDDEKGCCCIRIMRSCIGGTCLLCRGFSLVLHVTAVIGVSVLMVSLLRECMRCQTRGQELLGGNASVSAKTKAPNKPIDRRNTAHVSRRKESQIVNM